jgi:hypothetical protein
LWQIQGTKPLPGFEQGLRGDLLAPPWGGAGHRGVLDFYTEHTGLAVAERFLEEFERVAKLLVEFPGLGTPTTKGRKSFPLQVFPCSVAQSYTEVSQAAFKF